MHCPLCAGPADIVSIHINDDECAVVGLECPECPIIALNMHVPKVHADVYRALMKAELRPNPKRLTT